MSILICFSYPESLNLEGFSPIQSSTANQYTADLALEITQPNRPPYCAQTNRDIAPWWMVQIVPDPVALQPVMDLEKVIVYRNEQCCG